MKRVIRNLQYPTYYKDWKIYQQEDGYYVLDLYNEVVAGPFDWLSQAEEYIDEDLS